MSGQRNSLQNLPLPNHGHPGLWLDKHRVGYGDDVSSRNLVVEVCKIKETSDYAGWFDSWKKQLEALRNTESDVDVHLVTFVPLESSRLAVGLGAESVLENSIAIHRTYGVPFIPGSALKGLASSFAHRKLENDKWRKNGGEAHRVVFGDTDDAGFVTFFDALPLPDSWVLHPQVMTVHHQEYYQDGSAPPADWDSPNPNPFISATGAFLVALAGPSEWVTLTCQILERALKHEGIGAKTSSGFGRLQLSTTPSEYIRKESYADAGHVRVERSKPEDSRPARDHAQGPREVGRQTTQRPMSQTPRATSSARKTGKVKFWKKDEKWGYIIPDDDGKNIDGSDDYVNNDSGIDFLEKDQRVSYTMRKGKKGRLQAFEVEIKS